jgi:thiopurine S-methyltransferase
LDIPYLYQQGHQVFGVEAVAKAIEDLSNENSLGLKFNPETSTYATEDGRIRIYNGDIFTCPFEKFGPFDCVWDRGSFIALEYPFRTAYKEMIQRSLRVGGDEKSYHNFQYLLETVDYNREIFGGPPRAVDAKDMQEYFADWTNVEVVSKTLEKEGSVASKPDIGEVYQVVYLMTPK